MAANRIEVITSGIVDLTEWETGETYGYRVEAKTADGRNFQHWATMIRTVAERLIDKLADLGTIDPTLWIEYTPDHGTAAHRRWEANRGRGEVAFTEGMFANYAP